MIPRIQKLLDNQSIRYVLAGGVSYVVEISIFLLLFYTLHIASGIANALSLILSWTVNYTLSHHFVFRGHQTKVQRSVPRYAALALFNLAASSLLIQFIITHMHIAGFIAKPVLSLIFAAWTYVAYKKFVFNSNNKPGDEPGRAIV